MKNLGEWSRLALAATNARDDLRGVLPLLDQAIAAGVSTELLQTLRAIAVRHADGLRLALKAPDRPRSARSARDDAAWRSGGLWSVADKIGRQIADK